METQGREAYSELAMLADGDDAVEGRLLPEDHLTNRHVHRVLRIRCTDATLAQVGL